MTDKPPLSLVPDKPADIRRAECPEHGVQTFVLTGVATPMLNDKGRVMRRKNDTVYLCPECYREGRYTEVGR